MTSNEWFEVSVADGVAHLVFNRPDTMNTMTIASIHALGDTARAFAEQGKIRALVISSKGKHFCAGLDLGTEIGPLFASFNNMNDPRGRYRFQRWLATLMQDFDAMMQAPFPVLCAIQGGCVGGGLDFAAACDMRYCTEDAFFVVQEINIGMIADLGSLQRLPKLIPEGVAREYAYTGRRMTASRALQLGLVNEVYPDHQTLVEAVLATAREIAAKSPLAIAGSKQAMNFARDHSIADALEQKQIVQSALLSPEDAFEAITAAKQKRSASFKDILP